MNLKQLVCNHDWELIVNQQFSKYSQASNKKLAYAWLIVQRCKKCGKIQRNVIKVK